MSTITIIIHTRNEEKNIAECIASARLLTDQIVVIDMESTDKTKELAKQEGVIVKSFPFSQYVEPARAFGIDQARTEWIFILDADERITTELATEVQSIITSQATGDNKSATHYKVPRKNIFGRQQWLKHGGWWPDHQLRLIDKTYFKKWPTQIHSTPVITGPLGYLKQPIIHYFHGDLEQMVNKTLTFEDVESDLLLKAGRQSSTLVFFRKFAGELYRRLIRDQGFRDGTIGIIESIYQAYSKTITYLFLYEKKHSPKSRTV